VWALPSQANTKSRIGDLSVVREVWNDHARSPAEHLIADPPDITPQCGTPMDEGAVSSQAKTEHYDHRRPGTRAQRSLTYQTELECWLLLFLSASLNSSGALC
jgi:hypothetical protein